MVLDDARKRQDIKDVEYVVYDMVVHPCVADKAQAEEAFREELVRVMVDGVRQEMQLPLKKGRISIITFTFNHRRVDTVMNSVKAGRW